MSTSLETAVMVCRASAISSAVLVTSQLVATPKSGCPSEQSSGCIASAQAVLPASHMIALKGRAACSRRALLIQSTSWSYVRLKSTTLCFELFNRSMMLAMRISAEDGAEGGPVRRDGVHLRAQRLRASLSPRDARQMVFDAHDKAFAFFGGACARGIYDSVH